MRTSESFFPQVKPLILAGLWGFLLWGQVLEAKAQESNDSAVVVVRSSGSGPWSSADTWEEGVVPAAGHAVLIRNGHEVVYDVDSDEVIRSIHISGTLSFAKDRDTRLDVGLIRIQEGDVVTEEGFDCAMHIARRSADGEQRPTLLVGEAEAPIPAEHKAIIRLHYIEGMDPESCPAIVCCGGRMEFHGAPMARTWTKLDRTAHRGEGTILLPAEEVADWKPGDLLIVTGTTRQFGYKRTRTGSVVEAPTTEERRIERIQIRNHGEAMIRLDQPLDHDHQGQGEYRAEVANLSRNVVIESADPEGVRGHTMYHRHSAGAISYSEFRHLGKQGVLGRYSLHFHLLGDTMRGTSIIGASIWDSHNRWITIHGTNYLVVRDCVGYKGLGHGFFLEDGTEVYNVLDRNLAVQALRTDPLPDQILPFDDNLGSGFWWSNSRNSFTNNVAAECDQDGFRFEVVASEEFNPVLPVPQPDGTRESVDIRTLPFIRFDGNEAHCQRFFGLNLGGSSFGAVPGYETPAGRPEVADVDGVGPDPNHPFVIRDFKVWNTHWAFHAGSPSVLIDSMDIYDCEYGIWRCVTDHHEYHNLRMNEIGTSAIFYPRPGRSSADSGLAYMNPVDDLPPATIITSAFQNDSGDWVVRGTTIDNGEVRRVLVNGQPAHPTRQNFAEWEITIAGAGLTGEHQTLSAHAEDEAGNVEAKPHERALSLESVAGD